MTRRTILHVEDEADDRLIVKDAFARTAPQVDLVASIDGEAAIAWLTENTPDLVLLDLKLPRKSGFEVLQWVRSRPALQDVPVVIFTSSQEQKDVERATALGANSYVVKSVDLKRLREVLRGIAELAALRPPHSPR